jgi:hypothetical protein
VCDSASHAPLRRGAPIGSFGFGSQIGAFCVPEGRAPALGSRTVCKDDDQPPKRGSDPFLNHAEMGGTQRQRLPMRGRTLSKAHSCGSYTSSYFCARSRSRSPS